MEWLAQENILKIPKGGYEVKMKNNGNANIYVGGYCYYCNKHKNYPNKYWS